jgi:hypothetical protein
LGGRDRRIEVLGQPAQTKKLMITRHQWLMPEILPTQEAENRRIEVQRQPGQIIPQDLISKKLFAKKRLAEWLKV